VTVKKKVCKNAGGDRAHAKRPALYPGPRCSTCHTANKALTSANAHELRVQQTYELLPGEYAKLLEAQDGKCAICLIKPVYQIRRLAVDHDHKKEKEEGTRASIRGLLCKAHNTMLARARDNPLIFLAAYEYLMNPPAQRILNESNN
jgi:hypothetical protein